MRVSTSMKAVAGAVALTIGLAGTVLAQPGGVGRRGPGPQRGMMGGPLGGLLAMHPDLPLAALNLSDGQREQVRTILESHREEGRAVHARANAALEALRKATTGNVDEGAVGQHSQALGSAIGEAALLRAKVRSEVFAVLTAEQQAEAAKIAADRQNRAQQRRQQMEQRRQLRQQRQSAPPQG